TAAVARLCRQRLVPKGSIVFYEDDPGTSCYIILEGKVKVVVNSPHDGREHILGILKRGDLFGEMSLIDGLMRSATAIAVEETQVVMIQREEFVKLLENMPKIALKLLVVLSRRLRSTDRHVESLAFLSAPGRVARLLLELGEEMGQTTPQGLTFETKMTRQEMANLTGTSRETFTRVLMEYQDRGLVEIDRNQFVLRNETKLRELVV
ncbi:MAG: Crp/Fnr family transcriptional regulator, partial [Candidatus Sericytochromatia bacterium]|nr:Crp/Fnr family transcriptional regulator [Candidatus Tanganyikabacteria bacterium]